MRPAIASSRSNRPANCLGINEHGLILPGIEPVGAAVRGELDGRFGPFLLDLDRLSLGIDVLDRSSDQADGLIRSLVLQHERPGELGPLAYRWC